MNVSVYAALFVRKILHWARKIQPLLIYCSTFVVSESNESLLGFSVRLWKFGTRFFSFFWRVKILENSKCKSWPHLKCIQEYDSFETVAIKKPYKLLDA